MVVLMLLSEPTLPVCCREIRKTRNVTAVIEDGHVLNAQSRNSLAETLEYEKESLLTVARFQHKLAPSPYKLQPSVRDRSTVCTTDWRLPRRPAIFWVLFR